MQYNDQDTLLTPEQVVAMMLTKVCDIARAANSDLAVVEAVVGIPGWYTDSMRRAMLVSNSSHATAFRPERLSYHNAEASRAAKSLHR